ncbi:hypothetical protein AAZX31_08G054800 [Glycine max]|uniref:Uncharacterized protein n=1 Tax=Glycine max TaxID=3847 RepID=K7L551_SOYBN|nr:hypothetical protein JHK87_020450 [Glycine soja]KAH1049795.1 hypothetical protein GYH30_020350 [Glycine max]KRH41877.1 hypothetical protein GLYMA_08G056300v4 [Glycine max]|eukprot:XP_006584915.2 purple acid phosphatase 8 [Glycine max]
MAHLALWSLETGEGKEHTTNLKLPLSQIQFLTSGGGSKAWKGDMDKDKTDGIKFYYDGQGFMSAELEETNVKVVYYDILGKVLHVVNLPKGLGTSVSAI